MNRCMKQKLFQEIRNKTSKPRLYVTQANALVGNYHSASARAVRCNEWFARLYMHTLLHPRAKAFMVTLTYSDNWVPSYDFETCVMGRGGINPQKKESYKKSCIPCFNKDDVKSFIKAARKRFAKRNLSLKYLLCSEYGKRFTKRSHYHAIIFLEPTDDDMPFAFPDVKVIEAIIQMSWCRYRNVKGRNIPHLLGRIDISKSPWSGNKEIDDASGLRYCSKYITKDDYYKDDSRWHGLENAQKLAFEKYCAPFHLQSEGFGKDWFKHFDVKDALQNGVPVEFKSKTGITKKRMPLPRYCINNLFFRDVYNNVEVDCVTKDGLIHGSYNVRTHSRYLYKNQEKTYKWYIKESLKKNAQKDALKLGLPFSDVYRSYLWQQVRTTIWDAPNCVVDYDIHYPMLLQHRRLNVDELLTLIDYIIHARTTYLEPTPGFDGVKYVFVNGCTALNYSPYGEIMDKELFAILERKSELVEDNASKWQKEYEEKKLARERSDKRTFIHNTFLSYEML